MALSARKRFEILKRDSFRCRYCGASGSTTQLHVDHVEPRALGGSDDPSNLLTACRDCNLGKRARRLDDEQYPLTRADTVLHNAITEAYWRNLQDQELEDGRLCDERDMVDYYFPEGLPRGFT